MGLSITRVKNPNAEQLRKTFRDLLNLYGYDRENRLLFFFSGHGYSRDNNKGYLVPVDAPNPELNKRGFLQKAFTMQQINGVLVGK